jgi:hypothetical protein
MGNLKFICICVMLLYGNTEWITPMKHYNLIKNVYAVMFTIQFAATHLLCQDRSPHPTPFPLFNPWNAPILSAAPGNGGPHYEADVLTEEYRLECPS